MQADDDVVVVQDSRGVWTTMPAAMARDRVAELYESIDTFIDKHDTWGYLPNDEQQRVRDQYAEVVDLTGQLEPADVDTSSLKRFYAAGESERLLIEQARAEADERERDRQHARRVAEVAQLVASLGDDDADAAPAESEHERPSVKHVYDQHGLSWWLVRGRGPEAKYGDMATAEREAKRRATGRLA